MIQESYNTQVALSSTVYPLQNTKLQQAPGRGYYIVYATAGATPGTLRMNIWRGAEQVCANVQLAVRAGGGCNKLEDEIARFSVLGGETILIELSETAGTATTPSMKTEWHPL